MKFKFKIQQYQTEAVEQTVNVFAGQPSKTNAQYRRDLGKRKGQLTFDEEYVGWRNNDVELTDIQLLANIRKKLVKSNGFWRINAIRPVIKARRGRMRKFK